MNDLIEQAVIYLKGTWRFRWVALLFAWVVVVAGWGYVARIPDQYEASARVYVDTDSILRPLLRGLTVQTNVDQRVALMTRTLLSRPNLEKIARMTDIDIAAKTPEDMEELINNLASDIHLASTRQEKNLYIISYENKEPEIAKRIVQAVLTVFVESSLGEVRKDTDVAQKFLDQQIQDYEQRLSEAENRLMEFKRKNVGFLPGQGGDFFERLQATQQDLQQAKLSLREAEKVRDEMQDQLDALEESGDSPYYSASTQTVSPLDSRIQLLRTKLDELLLRYTDQHPDVIEIRSTISALEKQKEEEQKASTAGGSTSPSLEENPMYQQAKMGVSQANANVAAAQVRVREYEDRLDKLSKQVDILPQVETELKRLDRDYAVNKQNYEELLSRKQAAKMSEEAEQTGDNVQYRVIDPPRVPLSPSGPHRVLLSSLVLVIGLAGGLFLALLLSQINPVIFTRRTLQSVAGLPVFGAVSLVMTPEVRFKNRLRNASFAFASILLMLAYTVVLVIHSADLGDLRSIVHVVKEWV